MLAGPQRAAPAAQRRGRPRAGQGRRGRADGSVWCCRLPANLADAGARLWSRRIAALSLGHGIAMKLQPPQPGGATRLLWLPPRSLLVFTAEARYAWRHGIASKRGDRVDGGWRPRGRRVSVTLRRVRTCSTCRCAWPLACDSQGAELQLPTRQTAAVARAAQAGRVLVSEVEDPPPKRPAPPAEEPGEPSADANRATRQRRSSD